MIMRRRPLLRAAAVGGTAYMAGKSVSRRQTEQQYADADQEARIAALEQQQAATAYVPPPSPPPAPQAPVAAAQPSVADQLSRLIELHQQGALTDAEFAAAKASVLGT
jgi:hypothetical protein